ncbi:MAG TPA: zf-HC2 domain-containing protein, partial [Thermoanaerobaculia bacterium]
MATPHSSQFEELLPAYALGALDDDERRELEAHLIAGCAVCRQQLALVQGDVENLAELATPIQPAAATRERVLASIRETPAAAAPPRRPRWWTLAAAALLLVALWGVVRQASLGGEVERLTAERDRLAQRTDVLDREVRQTRQESERLAQALAIVATPGVQS